MKKSELEDFLLKGNLNLFPATFLDPKESDVLSRVSSLMRHWPDDDLYPSLLFNLLRLPRGFKKIRCVPHLGRLICADYFYKKKVLKEVDQFPHKRHLCLKLLKTRLQFPFGSRGVMGMLATFNLLKERETFEEQHILEAVNRIVPGVQLVKGSILDSRDKQNQLHCVYLEVEREENPEFSLDEIALLQNKLPDELKGCIEQLVPMTFMRRNEEEVYRNILALRDQLRNIRDIPQATITFEEQTQFDLFFTIVILRLVKGETRSIQSLFEESFPHVTFIPDRVDKVGVLRKHYTKEATVFRLQLRKSQFFRKDRSVDLYKARRRVVMMLSKVLGTIRDYNGGLILKQNERLEDFVALMPKVYDEFLLENFFYSITPITMQSILPASLIKEWFLAFSELLDKDIPRGEVYLLSSRQVEEATLLIVRADDSSVKDLLVHEVNSMGIPSLELAFSEINVHGTFCFGFLYRPSLLGKQNEFIERVRETMRQWSAKVGENQVLHIGLLDKEPSLDPRIVRDDESYIIIRMLFEGLMRLDSNGKPQLAIAESYDVSSDYKTYTFYLRECHWSNGMPVTAYDIEYSWKKTLNPDTDSINYSSLFLIKNGRLAKLNHLSLDEVGITVIDPKTLKVELEYPAPFFLESVAHSTFTFINSEMDKKHPGWAYQGGETYVCNGPFKLLEWKHGRSIVLEKNPHYWDHDSVKLKKINITMSERGQGQKLISGELDIIGRPMLSSPIIKDPIPDGEKAVSFPLQGVVVLFFNTNQFPFNHRTLRRAFSYAIDRRSFAHSLQHEFEENSFSLLPNKLSLHRDPLFPKFDVKIARALFREGLGEVGFVKSDFPRLSLHFCNGMKRSPLFHTIVEQWKETFGIDIHLESNEWQTHSSLLSRGDFQIGALELRANWSDPLHLFEAFDEVNHPINTGAWEHPRYRSLLNKAKEASTIKQRNVFLKEAEAFLAQEVPAVPLYQIYGNYLKTHDLEDVATSEFFQIDFKWAYKGGKS